MGQYPWVWGRRAVMQSNEPKATDAWHGAGDTDVRHKWDSLMEQPREAPGRNDTLENVTEVL